jgi:activator of HSP90 ATPase
MREQAIAFTRRQAILSAAVAFGLSAGSARAAAGDEISRNNEAIHQEVTFKADRKRLYEALTDAKQFNQVIKLSAAVKSGMALGNKPTMIAATPGGSFAVFGGHIIGRQIELVPADRIVQAWRVIDWDPGVYSIAKFLLIEERPGTKLIFDHTGFPQRQAQHLAEGWTTNYWEPLAKFLA